MKALRGLLARLFGAPATDAELVTGIVHLRGAGGGNTPPSPMWTLRFSFAAWRGADGIIHSTPLDLHRACTEEEMVAAMHRINGARIISARVRHTGAGSAELIELVNARLPADDPLHAHAAELARPVTREDERFGTLTLNRVLDSWDGTAVWVGDTIDLTVEGADEEELAAALQTAGALWDDEEGWNERIEAFAVQELLSLRNDNWRAEGEQPLTPAEFRARMRLISVTVYPDGSFDFWHDDGDLFWGHSIQVSGNLQQGPTLADIPG